jgi:hypothetical protein
MISSASTRAASILHAAHRHYQRFKYVFNGFDFDEMYDLERDPDEIHNVAGDAAYASSTGDMRARMYELMARFRDPYGDAPQSGTADRYCAARYLERGKRI